VTAVNLVLVSEARHNLPVMPVLVAGGLAGLALALRLIPGDRAVAGVGADRPAEPLHDVVVRA
jgi:hypothetical protein